MTESTTVQHHLEVVLDELIRGEMTLQQATTTFQDRYIQAVVNLHGGNLTRSARFLGVHRNTVRKHLRRNTNGQNAATEG